MKQIIILSLLLLIQFNVLAQQQKYVVVSDYDDTFRITGNSSVPKIWNALYTDKIFAGSDLLYQAFQKNGTALYFVSNTPEFMRKKVTRRINGYQLQPDSIFLYHGEGEKADYKLASVKWILQQHPDCKLVLLGDNSAADHTVFDSIRTLYPEKVLKIYIRPVKRTNPIPNEIQHFYTAFEVAHVESEAKRIDAETAKMVAEAILTSKKKYVKPRVLKLPEKPSKLENSNAELNTLQQKIFAKLWAW